eukprot:9483837-Pyramimonas_sp.AAC.1
MSGWCWLVHLRGGARPRRLVRAAASLFGATDANAVALTAWHVPASTSVRVVDLGGRGIMATPATVDAMLIVAMLATMLTAATGQP